MPNMYFDNATVAAAVPNTDIPNLVSELMDKLRYAIRGEGEVEELEQLRCRVRQLERDLESYRTARDEYRTENGKLLDENRKLKERVNDLLRAGAPKPELVEGEKQTIRDGNLIAAIKQLRTRIEQEHGYYLGLKEAKDLCDEYKRTLPVPEPVGADTDTVRF